VLKRLKTVLVESYVGAIALGMLFSQAVVHFASIFSSPVSQWISLRHYRIFSPRNDVPVSFSLGPAVPELIKCVALFAAGYVLLRWLYFNPIEPSESLPESREVL
jgi:hypothetical protein